MAAIYSQIFEDVSWLHFAVTWGQSLLIIRFVVYITSLLHLVAFFLFWSSIYSRSLPVTSDSITLHFIIFHYITLTLLITRSAHVSLLPSQAISRTTTLPHRGYVWLGHRCQSAHCTQVAFKINLNQSNHPANYYPDEHILVLWLKNMGVTL